MAETSAISAAVVSTKNRPTMPLWARPKFLAAVWLGLIAYGALIPFDFKPIGPIDGLGGTIGWLLTLLASPTWIVTYPDDVSSLGTPNWINDIVLNFTIFVPLGALLRIDGWRRSKHPFRQVVSTVLVVLMASWTLECVQSLMVDRFGSIQDILTNTGGGAVGAVLAVQAWRAKKWVVFGTYKRVAYVLYRVKRFLKRQRSKPSVMFAVVFINIAGMAWWYQANQPGTRGPDNLLPFSGQFERSYDVAAVQITRSMILYSLVAMLLSVQFFRSADRKKLIWIVAAVASLATILEVIQMMTPGTGANGTQPILALIAAGFTIVTVFLLGHAVHCSCRRHQQLPVGVDRRRVPFDYAKRQRTH